MKKTILAVFAFCAILMTSCDKEGAGNKARVTFRKANIAGVRMLALAQGGVATKATKAEGDMNVGPRALYSVSEDGTMVQVTYNVDVEGVNGEVAEHIKADLIISPGFVFPVGEGWLWLANCHYDVKGGWNNYPTDGDKAARHALSAIINDFNDKYHDNHGAHYLVRKSDGALFEWTLEAGAPDGMDDGFRTGGWNYDGINGGLPSLIRLQDKGSTLEAVNLLGNNISCNKMYPAEGDCLGGDFGYPGMMGTALGIIAPPSFEPVFLQLDSQGKDAFLLSIGGKLYLARSYEVEIQEGDGKEGQWTRTESRTDFYNLTVTGNSIALGSLICTMKDRMENSTYISYGETLSWWSGNDSDGARIHTLDPKAGTVSSRNLPEHYPGNELEYVDGAAEYQSKIVPSTLRLVRFEASSLTLQYVAYMSNGTELNFYSSVTGAERGKIKTNVGSDGNAGMVVTTMVRLN